MNARWPALLLFALPVVMATSAPEPARPPSGDDRIPGEFLARYCIECHGPTAKKGDLRLDKLASAGDTAQTREQWLAGIRRVQAGEMPPKGKARPTDAEVRGLFDSLQKRSGGGRVVLRRLNRVEYENTVHDLLGIDLDLRDLLPPDSSSHGFDNVGEALHTSSFLMDRYLDAADAALTAAIANGPQPPLVKKRYSLKETHQVKVTTERVFKHTDDAVVCFSSSAWQAISLTPFYPPDRGNYRFRLAVSGYQSKDKPVTFRVDAGLMLMAGKSHLVGVYDAPADKQTIIEFTDRMEPRNTIRILPQGLASAQAVSKIGADTYEGPGLAVHSIDVEGPLYDAWPPESHRRIFGDMPQSPAPIPNARNRVEVTSSDPEADARRILSEFQRRAYRRTVTEADLKPILALFQAKRVAGQSFEQAIRVALKAVMLSPEFLFLREKPGKLDDFALASRLSYFLWSSMPDAALFEQAAQKRLRQPEVLRAEVERMLRDPKAAALTENFLGQWLSLRDIDATSPDHRLYPEYDDLLKVAMLREPGLFFDDLLTNDRPLTNLVASDFTYLNERLARHYGIAGVEGHALKRVTLPPDSPRGGVLTMAASLKVTANGTYTSPVLRGARVLERILGTPPSPPPVGVAAVEPDIRGATTIRSQLAKHRDVEACATCHTRIDPPGFALESFDPIGGWRDHYRSIGRGDPVTIDGRRMPYSRGPKVEPADELPDGRKFRDVREFKQLLLADKDQLTRAFAEQLLTYATGAGPTPGDRAGIESIVKAVRAKGYGLRTLVHEIVRSELFGSK